MSRTTDAFSKASSLDQSADSSSRVLNCSNCGAKMDVRFVGRLSDKRAFCPYCGSEVDLPDSFRRVEWKREKEQNARGATATEFVLIETRRDSAEGITDGLPPRLDEIHSLLSEPGQCDFEQVFK